MCEYMFAEIEVRNIMSKRHEEKSAADTAEIHDHFNRFGAAADGLQIGLIVKDVP